MTGTGDTAGNGGGKNRYLEGALERPLRWEIVLLMADGLEASASEIVTHLGGTCDGDSGQ